MKNAIKRSIAIWIALILFTGALGLIDWKTGYELNFFAFYFLPVSIAAWFLGRGSSVIVSILSSVVWFMANELAGHSYSSQAYAVWNTIIRLSSFIAIGYSLATINRLLLVERKTADELKKTLSEINVLEGMLPICAQCKKIKNEQGLWQHIEVYFSQHSAAQFSHGYCPECFKNAIKEVAEYNKSIGNPRSG